MHRKILHRVFRGLSLLREYSIYLLPATEFPCLTRQNTGQTGPFVLSLVPVKIACSAGKADELQTQCKYLPSFLSPAKIQSAVDQ